jgi:hypothetical protein
MIVEFAAAELVAAGSVSAWAAVVAASRFSSRGLCDNANKSTNWNTEKHLRGRYAIVEIFEEALYLMTYFYTVQRIKIFVLFVLLKIFSAAVMEGVRGKY